MTALHTVGTLVAARGREWVVLPGSDNDMLMLRPLGGTEDEVTGILPSLETISPASFPVPDPTQSGDFSSGRLLRDALRLGFRSSAGPFRSFGRIAVEPRPYQLVPLLMALRLDPVRLLIADAVGIGKTIEALLIARELLDTGEARRLAVLCSPQLADQWRREMYTKFHLDAQLVLPSTVTRLERDLRLDESVFARHPITVVSTDFIKSDRRRHDFLRNAPDLVIVDEAHTSVAAGEIGARSRHQRHDLMRGLAADPLRHLILVTATPHSGKEAGFRALLALLDPALAELPESLAGEHNRHHREHLARHFVQRRRHDIARYLNVATDFPDRQTAETTYRLTPDYAKVVDRAVTLARERIRDIGGDTRQRIRWWAALALLRSLASSPAAAVATLRNRAATLEAQTPEEADEIGRRTVMDLVEDEAIDAVDVPPGADDAQDDSTRSRLLRLARDVEGLTGAADAKLRSATDLTRQLIADGHNPILFCRFIPTAEYVAAHLQSALGSKVTVDAVTGTLPPDEREARVAALGAADGARVLVCTDCLSEGVNLQHHFDAVVHYDLSWNPTRHEQREGRVDRYGQPSPMVRTVTLYGTDNRIDPIVLDVLLRKHQAIRSATGVSVPVPGDATRALEAIAEGLLVRGDGVQLTLDVDAQQQRDALHAEWQSAAERYTTGGRTIYAQAAMKDDAVATELAAARSAIGSAADVRTFLTDVTRAVGGIARDNATALEIDLSGAATEVRDLVDTTKMTAVFSPPARRGQEVVDRTHPLVEGLAAHVLDSALDTYSTPVAARCGALRTTAVQRRTTLLLVRLRFRLTVAYGDDRRTFLAEDAVGLAFRGAPDDAQWLDDTDAAALFDATATASISSAQRTQFAATVVDAWPDLRAKVDERAFDRAADLREAHVRVREAAGVRRARTVTVEPQATDLLGCYVLLPDVQAGQ